MFWKKESYTKWLACWIGCKKIHLNHPQSIIIFYCFVFLCAKMKLENVFHHKIILFFFVKILVITHEHLSLGLKSWLFLNSKYVGAGGPPFYNYNTSNLALYKFVVVQIFYLFPFLKANLLYNWHRSVKMWRIALNYYYFQQVRSSLI